MRKKFIILIFLAAFISVCLSGCIVEEDVEYYETEYFKVHIRPSGYFVRIIGLTDKGNELEELVIPAEIDGKIVSSLGTNKFEKKYFTGCKAKKIFITSKHTTGAAKNLWSNDAKMIFLCKDAFFYEGGGGGNRYVPAANLEYFHSKGYVYAKDYDYRDVLAANISFMNNYDENLNYGYHWIDDLDAGQKIITTPPVPERDGFTFEGWFLEPECVTPADLTLFVKENAEIETVFYAKWQENQII